MQQVNLLIKPVSGQCNMRCGYCLCSDLSEAQAGDGLMCHETAETLIRAAMSAVDASGEVRFSFQGGEPTLAGLDFYRDFLALERVYTRPGIGIVHSFQTNGLNVDAAWADFFQQNHFLVGLSIDGSQKLQDLYRTDTNGVGTWERVAQSAELLKKRRVAFQLLYVVTHQCASNARQTYYALKELACSHLQFIPCLDPIDSPEGSVPFSLTSEEYGVFLCDLFDAWYTDWKRGEHINILLFDDYVRLTMGLPAEACSTSGRCGDHLVVDADGSFYPCAHYALGPWRLGDLKQPLTVIRNSRLEHQFLAESARKPANCLTCGWMPLCGGGCKRYWRAMDGRLEHSYCSAFRQFFVYAEERLTEIARSELQFRAQWV